jgi:RES domain-containing protein
LTPLPTQLAHLTKHTRSNIVVWRLDKPAHVPTWDEGIGAFRNGGRWNPRGIAAIYTSFDPSTAILEVAVHAGFNHLDRVAHSMLEIEILDPKAIHVVDADDVPNPNWLTPGSVSIGQQDFGAELLAKHPMVAFPSVVSNMSWNLVINQTAAKTSATLVSNKRFALDGRLNKAP